MSNLKGHVCCEAISIEVIAKKCTICDKLFDIESNAHECDDRPVVDCTCDCGECEEDE